MFLMVIGSETCNFQRTEKLPAKTFEVLFKNEKQKAHHGETETVSQYILYALNI